MRNMARMTMAVIAFMVASGRDHRPTQPTSLGPSISSAPSVTLTGVVTDAASSQPIAGAAIEWVGAAEVWGDRGHGVVTDANGFYQMVAAGISGPSTSSAIWVRASKAGFVSRIEQVPIRADVTLDFQLTPEASRGASR